MLYKEKLFFQCIICMVLFSFNLLRVLQILTEKTNFHLKLDKKQLNGEDNIQLEGALVCMKCNKKFSKKSNLTRHMDLLHAGRFKFYCDQCRKGFGNNIDYKKHMNKHAGIMYRCTMCTKTFSDERSRDYHMSIHTGVYRFICSVQ